MQNVFDTKVFKVVSKGKDDISYGWKGAGVAVPVFSLKSSSNFGIGEFLDLKLLADWCNKVGLKMIQILPINDTRTDGSWDNSYPYKAISTKALHPIYLNLDKMGQLDDKSDREYFRQQKEILNAKDYVDYPEVMKVKEAYFKKIFHQTWNDIKEKEDYKVFFNENKDWLVPYASFCNQRDYKSTRQQVESQSSMSMSESVSMSEFSYFLQYHLDKQLKETIDYLHEKGIALKGDIPIGIGRDSIDALANPELFNLDCQAGAPPDAFATEGQNWGFPTYNWEAMAKDDYRWWRERLTHMSRYFDAYRIDHILGFFRIWEIPIEYSQGTMGHFSPALPLEIGNGERVRGTGTGNGYGERDTSLLLGDSVTQRLGDLFLKDKHDSNKFHPRINMHLTQTYNELDETQKETLNKIYDDYFYHRNEALWKAEALKKLPKIIEASDMLVCGEDLGMVPACVPEVMQQLNILSLEVQRMPKKFGDTFVNPKENPYLSVDTTSTHDTSTLRGWWEENGELTNRFYREMLGHHEGAPYFAEPWVCKEIIKQHMESSSMWVIIPIQDYIAMDGDFRWDQTQREQINIPANPHHHWCYKMYQSIEELIERNYLNDMISDIIKESGRN
ncbi:MAG: 4-alpha-glucanotransferase [Bacteroidales bacterium]|nr:4-alpha-glucanotransferase [Bacteroidales bacterium]